ncbi:MAG: GAF domain-containing protein [Candidatus Thermofonsia bacterium]|nr:MAG: GAF domain-containing protein [Candidatus Thermofonsia bacterium]
MSLITIDKYISTKTVQTATEKFASERLQTLYIVNDMLKHIEADGLQMSTVLPRVLNLAVKQLDGHDGSIIVVNRELEIERAWLNSTSNGEPHNSKFLDDVMSQGLAGQVIRTKEPSIINDTRLDKRWLRRPGHTTTLEPWSVICTPFVVRDRAIGAITIHKPGINQFDVRDLDLLNAISNQAASTIENARLFEESQRQLQISALLHEASRIINSSLDIQEIMQSLLAQMNDLLHAEALSIALVNKETNELVYQVAEGMGSAEIVGLRLPISQGLSGWVVEHHEPVLVNDTSKDKRFYTQGDTLTGYETHAMICAPMQFKGEVLGTIQAINPPSGHFTHEDLNLLVNLANIASSAIGNAQQFAKTQEAEARYNSLFQDSVDPIFLTDLDGVILDVNRRAVVFSGYTVDELTQNMNIRNLHPRDVRLPDLHRMAVDEVRVFNSQLLGKNEKKTHVEVYAKRIRYGRNDIVQWIHHDISKHVELEQMRQDLTAMLFHDLQSPLGNVISSLELLSQEIPPDDENSVMNMMLDIAARSSQRLQTLVHSLLDINRLEAGAPLKEEAIQQTSLLSLVQDVEDIETPNLEKRHISLERNIPDDLPDIYVDADMIRRVLINLVDNALKYSNGSQKITISAKYVPNKSQVLVSVSDQGKGIPPRYRKTIFEKFQRILPDNSTSKGLGLGLAFCRLAVEAHNGRIWVDDAPGGGARFNFTLPASPSVIKSSQTY